MWFSARVIQGTAEAHVDKHTVDAMQDSEDIRYMVRALKALGIKLEERWDQAEMVVHGCNGRFPVEGTELFLGNAGTAMRRGPGTFL